ncbi:hypothetical protein EPN95_02130 [Patescibacteria group bacterium]|nr:MAG: hypothetical protein EPN95_02130 [Patescibacteria group bacterium]
MVRITSKEPGIVQAQVAQFASEHVGSSVDRTHILENLSDIAITKSIDDTSEPVTREAYVDFMKDHLHGTHSDVQDGRSEIFSNRAAIMQAYDEFAPDVKAQFKSVDGYIAGGTSIIFPLHFKGKEYMVRKPFPKDWDPAASVIDHHIAAAALTHGLPHFEEVVAASYEDGVTVAEKMPGKTFLNLELRDIEAITDIQLAELIKTIQEADRLGLELDFNPENFLYDKEAGFGLIDLAAFSDVRNKNRQPKRLSEMLALIIQLLPIPAKEKYLQVNDYENGRKLMKAVKEVTSRYKEIILSDLSQDVAKEAISEIGTFTDYYKNL